MSWSTSEFRVRLARRKTGLSPPVKYFTDRSKAVLLLWIFYGGFLSCVYYAFVRVYLYVPCGHLLGKRWALGSRLWCLTLSFSLSHWYPGSGVVLDCFDSWSLVFFFLTVPSQCFSCGSLCYLCLCLTVLSVPCSLVVTCWERAYPSTLLYLMFSCLIFVTFQYGVLCWAVLS